MRSLQWLALPPEKRASLARAAVMFVLVAAWTAYLLRFMPSVSRGDFLLAIMRQSIAAREGDWWYALTWPVHILGGHIVFYERVLQLVNYYVLNYSPAFVKFCAIAGWMLVGWGLYRVVERSSLRGAAKLVCLLGLALITFNPIPWDVLAWPDADVPYLSSLVVLLFSAGAFVRRVNGPLEPAALRWLALLSVLVIIGSGVGWSILPVLLYLLVVRAVLQRDFAHVQLILAVAGGTLLLVFALVTLFPETLRLGLVTQSMQNLDFARLGSYFLALQGTLFGLDQRPANVRAGAALFAGALLVYALYKRRHRHATEAELLFLFGVVSLALVSLGRWKLNMDRPATNLPTYYHIFALPYYYGLLLMLARLLPQRWSPWVMTIVFAGIVASVAQKLDFYHRNFRGQSESYTQMLDGVRGWRMTEALRLIGEAFFNQQIFLEFLPELQRAGKYQALSADFHAYRSSQVAPPQPSSNGHACNREYRNLQLLDVSRDQRAPYTQGYPEKPFYRFVGVARNDRNCDDEHVAVSLVSSDGIVNCKTWTTANVYWHFDSRAHAEILRSPYAFDFSCPVEGRGDLYLVSSEHKSGRIMESVKVPQ